MNDDTRIGLGFVFGAAAIGLVGLLMGESDHQGTVYGLAAFVALFGLLVTAKGLFSGS